MEEKLSRRRAPHAIAAVLLATLVGCASTEFYYEGPGQPSDRASGAVPPGAIGVCKLPGEKRPPVVNAELWEDLHECTPRTPEKYIRVGYNQVFLPKPELDANMEHLLQTLRDGQNENSGNGKLVTTFKVLHENGLKDPAMHDRVARETSRTSPCDYTYLLNTMARERQKLTPNEACTVMVYDPKKKTEVCLFDTSREEVVWFTSSWTCATHTLAAGDEQSCYRLCGYDDYCARQVSCAAPDIELYMCALGVCLPVAKAGIY